MPRQPRMQPRSRSRSGVIDGLVEFGAERDELTRRDQFEDLDVDSLDLVELAQIVEDEFGVELRTTTSTRIETVGDVDRPGGAQRLA